MSRYEFLQMVDHIKKHGKEVLNEQHYNELQDYFNVVTKTAECGAYENALEIGRGYLVTGLGIDAPYELRKMIERQKAE